MGQFLERTYHIVVANCIVFLAILIFAGAGSASLGLTQKERQYILERPLVRAIGVEGYAPVLDADSNGYPVGITPMVLEEIAAITGLVFEVTMYENIESTPYIDRDEFDVYLAVPQNFVHLIPNGALSEPFLSSSSIIYANTSIPFDDLQGRRFAAVRDGSLPEGIAEENVVYFDTRKECIMGVNSGLADYGFGNAFSVHYYVLEYGLRNLMTIPLETEPRTYHFVFVNQDPLLVSVIDKAIQSIDDTIMQNIILSSISMIDRQLTLQELLRMYGLEISLVLSVLISLLIIALVGYYRSNHTIKTQAADLSYNQELLQQSQAIAHLGSWTFDLETHQLDWSDEVYRIFGLEPQQVAPTYETFLEYVHPDDRNMVDKAYKESIEDCCEIYDIEHRILNVETGDTQYVNQKYVNVQDDAGKVISSRGMVHDITQQKHAQRLLQARLNLIEVSDTNSLEGVLQEALDEACDLTNSPIGFYHFVDSDEKNLTLKAWSTRTLEEFCQIEGKDMHYSIDEAGVWADCVRQRKPIIHNDYESIPHRKGMPEGHAGVTRELVVPIMRRDRIVAVLGVGNKPKDYSKKDLDTILYFADVAWEIAERKQAEEKVHVSTLETERLYRLLDEEMRSAQLAHQRLVQQQLPEFDAVNLTVFSHPSTYVGGDFAHAIKRDNHLILYITDITGHGFEGTIFSLFVKESIGSYLDLVAPTEITPDRILKHLNQQVHKGHYPSEYAVAIFLMIMNVENGEVVFSAAGFQNPAVLIYSNGTTEMLVSPGLPISPDIPPDIMEFELHKTSIPKESFLFLGTDGIFEQFNGAEMYEQRLLKLLKQCNGLPHTTIKDIVNADFHDFLGEEEQADDVTFIVLSTREIEEHILPASLDSLDTAREHALTYYKDHLECETIAMGVHELVANAIEHGNRCDADKKVTLLLTARAVVVEDEGDGFDWWAKLEREISLDLDQEGGRGIARTQLLVGKLVYNEKGNRVSLLLER